MIKGDDTMCKLKAGFARVDITPPLGTTLSGYFQIRYADGVLDPLYATAVTFDDGNKKAIIFSLDIIGFNQKLMNRVRSSISDRTGVEKEAVFVACTHTHLGPCTANSKDVWENPEYIDFLVQRLGDAAILSINDLAPAKLSYTHGRVEDVAFIRRYRMKDGSVRTNPGYRNPDILEPIGTPDEESSLLIIKRDNKPEIGIVNFQVHPDVIGGCKISADYPKFVRDTYEKFIDNSLCMYINGAQGDTNHIDVRRASTDMARGYERAKYMGKKIALSVIANYELAKELNGSTISYGQNNFFAIHNKGTKEEEKIAAFFNDIYQKEGKAACEEKAREMGVIQPFFTPKVTRIAALIGKPEEKELYLTAVAVGDVVFAGFPGEPFTEIGRSVKAGSKFELTITACCANGYEGYYPMKSAYDEGGYEATTAMYKAGTAEKMIEESLKLVNSL